VACRSNLRAQKWPSNTANFPVIEAAIRNLFWSSHSTFCPFANTPLFCF